MTRWKRCACSRSPAAKVSSHYVVGKDGTVVQMVSEENRAWHAGVCKWQGRTDINSCSVGIEMVHRDQDAADTWPDAQYAAVAQLILDIRTRHRVPNDHVIFHSECARTRRAARPTRRALTARASCKPCCASCLHLNNPRRNVAYQVSASKQYNGCQYHSHNNNGNVCTQRGCLHSCRWQYAVARPRYDFRHAKGEGSNHCTHQQQNGRDKHYCDCRHVVTCLLCLKEQSGKDAQATIDSPF